MLAQELAEEGLKEQGSLPTSGEPKAPEVTPSTSVFVEKPELGSDGRPLLEPEGSHFPTDSHESDKIAKKLLTSLQREMSAKFHNRSLLLDDLKELGMAGDLSDDGQHLTMAFEDVNRLVTTMRMAEVILNERVQTHRKAKWHKSSLNLMRNIAPICPHS